MMHELIGQTVKNQRTNERGIITAVDEVRLKVDHAGRIVSYPFPNALAETLLLKDKTLRDKYRKKAEGGAFESFKKMYRDAVRDEIRYIQQSGGKKIRLVDGQLLSYRAGQYMYSFETDAELHFPDSTKIRIYIPGSVVSGFVIACEEFSIMFQTSESLGTNLEMIEFTADQWMLLEALTERISEMDASQHPIAYEVACQGKNAVNPSKRIVFGPDTAVDQAVKQPVTFIWGPPGTGKTTTLAKIAVDIISRGKRVLMLSYSNVSVDGALLRVSKTTEGLFKRGEVIRYGYPRIQELIDSEYLTSYRYVLNQNPELKMEYDDLLQQKRKMRRNDPKRAEITKRLSRIRTILRDAEKELIHQSAFVATTVSKAIIDMAVFQQRFDYVIFDEASMAYVPQVVFAAGLAKEGFCCFGDFRQLPAIVQNPEDQMLSRDIFEHTRIVEAVENRFGHDWLVMLNSQYRMHPEIAEYIGAKMYGGLLRTAHSIHAERQMIANNAPLPQEPMGLIDISDTYSVCVRTSDYSRINLLSAMLSVYIAAGFPKQIQVGVITPYNAQSRLIVAMLRDLEEQEEDRHGNKVYSSSGRHKRNITSATVHQFQGSEKDVIIYDAVDCFRMPYPGTLLTSKKNDMANRLFNVAITRVRGKFLMIANRDYLKRKRIARDLLFTRVLDRMADNNAYIYGENLISELDKASDKQTAGLFLGDRDDETVWQKFVDDLRNANSGIHMDVPGVFSENYDQLDELIRILQKCEESGIKITIRIDENVILPEELEKYERVDDYVTTPFTMIDSEVIWFGQPLAASDFVSEGNILPTRFFPCIRFRGKHLARSLKSFLEF